VLSAVVQAGYKPKLVLIEVNNDVPPPLKFSVLYEPSTSTGGHWDEATDSYTGRDDAFQGCSLSMVSTIMREYGYTLLQLDGWDAMYIRNEYAPMFERAIHRGGESGGGNSGGRGGGVEQAQERILFHLSGIHAGGRLVSNLPGHSPCLFKYNLLAQAAEDDRFSAGSRLFRFMVSAGRGAPFTFAY
jgi:hypothetical protein